MQITPQIHDLPVYNRSVKVAYIGNFVPEHSTENHVRQAWENQGHYLVRVQEGDPSEWDTLMEKMHKVDLILWTRTASESAKIGYRRQWEMLSKAKSLGIPTVAFHLDRWWGLDREAAVWTEPFFRCEYVITADGGHQEQFASVGVNHVWMPPAVALSETEPGEPTAAYRSRLAFVGSWQPGYHAEWTHRPALVKWLKDIYPDIRFWPRPGQGQVRGESLRNLYASVDVVIGDSCLVGGATHYWSDRIPETVGRGGFLIHPYVHGMNDHFSVGEHFLTWKIGEWDILEQEIEWSLGNPDKRREIAAAGRAHVIEHHTYDVRVQQIIELVS